MKFKFDIIPMGAVRMTTRGKWVKPDAQRYLSYKHDISWSAKQQNRLEVPLVNAVVIPSITFYMPIPKDGRVTIKNDIGKRISKKVKPGDMHTSKPDVDNLVKGIFDCFNGVVWRDDGQVCDIGRIKKVYGDQPGVEIEVSEVTMWKSYPKNM